MLGRGAIHVLLDGLIRNSWFFALVGVVGLWELAAPRGVLTARRSLRWPTSFTLGPFNALLATVPLAPFALAIALTERGWGLSTTTRLPLWVTIAVSVLLLDLLFYFQHRAFHAVPVLWSVHRVHHADVDFDYTTAFRFHPIEALLTNGTALAAVTVFGLPAFAVLVHQTLATGMTIFEHANARCPSAVEVRLRRIFVTPDMHRIHHSTGAPSTDSNFATILSCWDRWLGTYRSHATRGRDGMEIGLTEFRDPKYLTLPWTLAMPFLRPRPVRR